jgi:preprotein translocase SecF subunit
MRFFKDTNYNFVKFGRVAFIVSGILLVLTTISLILKGGPSLSIDFAGGLNVRVKVSTSVDITELKKIRDRIDVDEVSTIGVNNDRLFFQDKGAEQAEELASAIVNYREEVGKIESLDELKKLPEIELVDYDEFQKVFTVGEIITEKTTRMEETGGDIEVISKVNINTIDKEKMIERVQEVKIKSLTADINKVLEDVFPSINYQKGRIDLNGINDKSSLVNLLSQIFIDDRAVEIANDISKYRKISDEIAEMKLISDFDELKSIADLTKDEQTKIKEHFYLRQFEIEGTEVVGPRVSGEITRTAILALIYATIGMLIYIAFRFDFRSGVVAIIALVHDVFIVLGVCSLFNIEMSLTVIAAFLTTVGYSINDTVVYYDRIREGLLQQRKETYAESLNRCINENLSRTILTGISSLIVLGVLFFKGGKALKDFSSVLIAGIIMGTYSSIYVAAPLLIEWNKISAKSKIKRGKKKR